MAKHLDGPGGVTRREALGLLAGAVLGGAAARADKPVDPVWYTPLAADPDGRCFYTGTNRGNLDRWDAATWRREPVSFPGPPRGPDGFEWARRFAVTPDCRWVLGVYSSGLYVGALNQWQRSVAIRPDPEDHVGDAAVALSDDGALAAAGARSGAVRVWDARSGRLLHTLAAHAARASCLRFAPGGRLLLSAAWPEERALLWDLRDGAAESPADGPGGAPGSACFSPSGRYAAADGRDRRTRLWDVAAGEVALELGEGSGVAPAFLPGGRRLLTLGEAGLQLWDASTGRLVRAVPPDKAQVWSALPSADGRLALTALYEHLRVIDLESGEVARVLAQPRERSD